MKPSKTQDQQKDSLLKSSFYMQGIRAKTSNIPWRIRILLPIYKYLQILLLLGSIAFLIYMRIQGQYFINSILTIWRWNLSCQSIFWTLSGMVYAFSNLGFVNFFLTKDAIRKLTKRGTSIRASIKLLIDIVLIIVQIIVFTAVFLRGILDQCGSQDNVTQVKRMFMFSSLLYTPYLFSFLIYTYLRFVLERNEEYRAVYDNFLKSKYT